MNASEGYSFVERSRTGPDLTGYRDGFARTGERTRSVFQHGFRPGGPTTCGVYECERQSREACRRLPPPRSHAERERAERLRLRREITDRRPDLDGLP